MYFVKAEKDCVFYKELLVFFVGDCFDGFVGIFDNESLVFWHGDQNDEILV